MILPTSPSFSLSGKKALVAGASSGIGAACAVALARAGADVLLAARRKTELNEIVGALAAEGLQAIDTKPADFDAVMNINVRGAYFLTQAVAKGLLAHNKPGSLINISSQMALIGGQERAVYCASKHAVEGFTKAMAIEWGKQGIRVNTICPTFVLTELTAATFADPEKRTWIDSKIKLDRVGSVQDIMGAVVYLASDAAALVTASALKVDGGWTAG